MTPTNRPYLVAAGHIPTVAEQHDDRWGVYCHACSQQAEDYVWPCREGVVWDVPTVLVAADRGNSVASPQLCSDKNGFHDAHDWRPDPSGALVECPGHPVPHVGLTLDDARRITDAIWGGSAEVKP